MTGKQYFQPLSMQMQCDMLRIARCDPLAGCGYCLAWSCHGMHVCLCCPLQAVTAAEVQAYRHLPVTPVESAAWVNRLNQEMWATFWQPFLLANNLSSWQVWPFGVAAC